MSHTVIEMNCPGCGARVSTGQSECEWCHKPIIISTFNSVYSMPMPEVNKYAGAYKKALSENPDDQDLNNSGLLPSKCLHLHKTVLHRNSRLVLHKTHPQEDLPKRIPHLLLLL